MNDKNIYNFTVGELIEILQQYPQDMPVVVSGYENGYENFYQPFVKKVIQPARKPILGWPISARRQWNRSFTIGKRGEK